MTLLRLAGFSSVRVTSQWQGTEAAPSETELTVLRNVAGAAQLSAVRVYLSDLSDGVARDAADARGARAVRRLRDEPQAAAAVDQGRDHRQRAEHQPLLAAAVQPERHRRRRTGVHRAPRTLLRRRQAGRPGDARLGRRARAAGHRPSRHRPRHALAGRVPQGHGHRLPGERAHPADHGRARVPSVRRHLGPVAGHPPPQLDHDRPRRLRPPDADARDRVRQLTAGRLAAARSSTTSSGSSRRSRRARRRSTRAPSRRRRGRSTRSPRARTTRRRSSSRSASRT